MLAYYKAAITRTNKFKKKRVPYTETYSLYWLSLEHCNYLEYGTMHRL